MAPEENLNIHTPYWRLFQIRAKHSSPYDCKRSDGYKKEINVTLLALLTRNNRIKAKSRQDTTVISRISTPLHTAASWQ